jgi:hypothetical protein
MKTIKISKGDQFIWLIVTEKAKEIYISGLFDLYILHDDDSETLIEGFDQINQALENGLNIGIEVGFANDDVDLFEHPNRLPIDVQNILNRYLQSDLNYADCEAMLTECEMYGYTFDYGLSAEPFNLRPNGE